MGEKKYMYMPQDTSTDFRTKLFHEDNWTLAYYAICSGSNKIPVWWT